MATYPVRRHLDPEYAAVYSLVSRWRDQTLRSGASLIDPRTVAWTLPVASDLERRIVSAPDKSGNSFVTKLTEQLAGASQEVHLLLADLLVVHLLPTWNIKLPSKLALIDAVGAMAPTPFSVPETMHPALLPGLINAGPGFMANRFWIVSFLIRFAGRWLSVDDERREHLLDDPWAMKDVVADVPGERDQSQRNALLFLLFPDTFENITSDKHKRRIVEAHADAAGDDPDLDRRLLAARESLSARFGEDFNWYHPSIKSTWTDVERSTRSTKAAATSVRDRAWLVRMKREGGVREVPDAVARGDCRVFWTIDVAPGSSLDDIRQAFIANDADSSSNELGNRAGQVHRFISRMQAGDRVLAPDGADLYVGTITSSARFEEGEWVRDVDWANPSAPIERDSVSPALYSRLRTLLTVTEISDLSGELALLADVSDDSEATPLEVAPSSAPMTLRTIDSDTARELHLDRDWLQDIVELMERKRQLIFFGPPGTGKTHLAERLAEHLVNDPSHYRVVQFHPSYAYEDFVEGFRPAIGPDGAMVYELRPGPLKQLADEARADPGNPYLLIIDEINRGNLAKIFGELYYLLEYRERSIVLQYGGGVDDEFSLPTNLFLVGTMNTADRSIALVDAAIRRRFGFVEFSPLEPPVGDMLRTWLRRQGRDDRPARLLDELNHRLDDRDLAIGPSYLMKPDSDDDAGLRRIWRYEIMPLLDEQFYGRREATARVALDALLAAIAPPARGSAPPDTEPGASGDAADRD